MNTDVSKRSGLGCLGCFSIICLTFVLLVELAVVWWLNPRWFDRMAFWRGPVYEPHVTLVNDPNEWARMKAEAETEAVAARSLKRESVPMIFGRLTVDYDPAAGAELPITERGSVRIPPGAIDGAAEVSVTPMLRVSDEMAAPFVGPIVDLRIGDREHHRFRKPVTLTLPFETMGAEDRPSIAGWQNGRWVKVPSRIDHENKTVSAELAHASAWSVIGGFFGANLTWTSGAIATGVMLPAVLAAVSSSTVRGNARAIAWLKCSDLETSDEYFRIHYMTSGSNAVPGDDAFRRAGIPFDGTGTPPGHPLYVRYIGKLLEDCVKRFPNRVLLNVPSPKVAKYNVFIMDMSDYGASETGGPMFLTTRLLRQASGDSMSADELMRYTVAHELTHVAQDAYFNPVSASYGLWFVEMMAAYVGWAYWDVEGAPVKSVAELDLLNDRGRLLLMPMDSTKSFGRLGGQMTYRYFIFPRWLDSKFGARTGSKFLVEASDSFAGKLVDLDDLESACRTSTGGHGLADLFSDFAMDFYHDDLWGRKLIPEVHGPGPKADQATKQSLAPQEFSQVTLPLPPTGATSLSNAWATHDFGFEEKNGLKYHARLSAEAVYMDVGSFPKTQKAKLVVRVVPYQRPTPDLNVYLAEDRCGPAIPCQGKPGTFEEVKLSIDKPENKIIDLVGQKGHPDRVTVLAVNRSIESSHSGISVQRWLLVPPANVQFERAEPLPSRRWKVKWDRVGLKDHAPVWGQYEVLRRRVGQPDSEFVPLNRTEDEFYGGDVPTDDDYVFTVKVVDLYGNKSHAAPVPDRDPFVGDWFGVIREKHGLYLTESMVQIRSVYDDKVAQARSKIRQMPESTDYERQRKREEIESQEFVEELGGTAMEFAGELAPELGAVIRTAGFPATFSVRRRDGNYYLTVKSVFGFGLNEEEFGNLPLEPAGNRALRLKKRDVPLLSKMVFHSSREDFIHARDGVVVTHKSVDTGINLDFLFSWWFYRSGVP